MINLHKHTYEIKQGVKTRKDGTVAVYYYIDPIPSERVPGLVATKSMFPHHDPKQIIRMVVTFYRKRAMANLMNIGMARSHICLFEITPDRALIHRDSAFMSKYFISNRLERGVDDIQLFQ